MNREFLDFYNRELSLLYEQAGDFAEEYPGIAERLGFLGRMTHGANGRSWVREFKSRIGEAIDYAVALE